MYCWFQRDSQHHVPFFTCEYLMIQCFYITEWLGSHLIITSITISISFQHIRTDGIAWHISIICWRLWMLAWKNASWVCTLSPFALLMARRGRSTLNTRRIFTTEMALELNTEMTTNKWMNQWITELSHRWTLTAKRKRWGTRWRPAGPGGWRRFCRRNLDEGKLHTQSSEQHTTHIFINVHIQNEAKA